MRLTPNCDEADSLAADERFHAHFGYLYLETQREWLDARPAVKCSLARYLQYAFAMLEQHMGANPAEASDPTDAERAIGLPDLTDVSATFQETILNACVPGLERFGISARAAWENRTASEAPPDPSTKDVAHILSPHAMAGRAAPGLCPAAPSATVIGP